MSDAKPASLIRISGHTTEEPTLRERIDDAMEGPRNYIRSRVMKWLMYYADLGVTKLYLENCEGLPSNANYKEIAEWLSEEGFRVDVPRLGRVVIWLK